MDSNFRLINGEIVRFAGENSFAKSVVPHWAPISREGIQALYDNGIRDKAIARALCSYNHVSDISPITKKKFIKWAEL